MERIRYKCSKCNYEFTRKSTVTFNYCPYCGKKGTVGLKKPDEASRLLDS